MDDISALLSEAAALTKPTLEGLGRASAMASEIEALEAQIAELNAKAKDLSEKLTILSERDMPALMDELNIKEFTLKNGRTVRIKPIYIGKIDADHKEEAYEWLEKNGYGSLVKTAVEARFGMGDIDQAKELAEKLEAAGYVVNVGQSVHSATLGKFVKTMLVEGRELPEALFHPNVLRRAQII
jgi:hypothetical protein